MTVNSVAGGGESLELMFVPVNSGLTSNRQVC